MMPSYWFLIYLCGIILLLFWGVTMSSFFFLAFTFELSLEELDLSIKGGSIEGLW